MMSWIGARALWNERKDSRARPATWSLPVAIALMVTLTGSSARAGRVVTVPIELRAVYVYVRIVVDGKPATFVLDTGAGANVITPEAVARLHLKPGKTQTHVTGAAGQAGEAPSVKIGTIAVGEDQVHDQLAYVIPLPQSLGCDGLLGTPFLRSHAVTIDYEHARLTLTPSKEFHAPAGTTQRPLRFFGDTPFLEATADGCTGWFRMDTGAGNGATLFAAFAKRNHLEAKYSPAVRIVTGRGVGGLLYGDLVRLPRLEIGPFRFDNPVAELSHQLDGTFGDQEHAGNLGGEIWQRFTVTLDYAKNAVYLSPNSRMAAPFDTPRSGLAVETDKGVTVVRDVTPNGPGADAGIVVGDIVTAVDGVPMEKVQQLDLTARLRREPGTNVRLRVRSADGTERDVVVTLRDLL